MLKIIIINKFVATFLQGEGVAVYPLELIAANIYIFYKQSSMLINSPAIFLSRLYQSVC